MKFINFSVPVKYKRLCLLYGSIFFTFIVLSLRLVYLQIVSSDQLMNESNKRSLRVQNIPESRGLITDRMGRILAINTPVYSVGIDPKKIDKSGGINANIIDWTILSNILDISLEKLIFFIQNHNTDRFLYLSRHIDPKIAQYISRLKIPGMYLCKEVRRYYPSGPSAAHLVGITNIDNQGIEGIEKSFDFYLAGYPKKRVIQKDRLGRVVEDIAVLAYGRAAKNIVLSIDQRLQYLAYHELNKAVRINRAQSGSIILIDINTGEILAMANSPSYDPNDFYVVDKSIMRNRAITDVFEPGSTIKPIVIIAALQNKIIEKDTVLYTSPYKINGHQIKDVSYYDKLTIREILQKSSNVGVSKLALAMPISVLINSYLNFGVGKSTNIGLIGENKGKIYSYNNRYYSEIERAALSYGYGLMITPLQLAKIYTIIGSMGRSRPLSIIKVDHPNRNSSISSENQIFPKSLIRTVIDMMEVTTLSNSGCYQAAIEGYRVSVKTGTTKKLGSHGKYINKYIACTAGIAPSSNPRFALVVIIDDPKNGYYYGGMVSAPVFKSVMSNTLRIMNINPDFLR